MATIFFKWWTSASSPVRYSRCAVIALAALLVDGKKSAQANDIVSEVRLGVLAHDVAFAGGKERGADFNSEVLFVSPFSLRLGDGLPNWLRWVAHPRPTLGIEANFAGATSQVYVGMTWTALLATAIFKIDDGLDFSYQFGPSFNNGDIRTDLVDRKSLGSNILFHLGADVSYRLTPKISIGVYFDHNSNGDLAKPNESLNDFGLRAGYLFGGQ